MVGVYLVLWITAQYLAMSIYFAVVCQWWLSVQYLGFALGNVGALGLAWLTRG